MKYFRLLESDFDGNINDLNSFLKQSKDLNWISLAAIKDHFVGNGYFSENELADKGVIFDFDAMVEKANDILLQPSIGKESRQMLKRLNAGLQLTLNLWGKNSLKNKELDETLHSSAKKLLVAHWFEKGANQSAPDDNFSKLVCQRLENFVNNSVEAGLFHESQKQHFEILKERIANKIFQVWKNKPQGSDDLVQFLNKKKLKQAVQFTKNGELNLENLVLPALKIQIISRLKDKSLFTYNELTERLRSIADSFEDENEIEFDKKVLYRRAVDEIFTLWRKGIYGRSVIENQFELVVESIIKPIKFDAMDDVESSLRDAALDAVLLDYKNEQLEGSILDCLTEITNGIIRTYTQSLVRDPADGREIVENIISQLVLDIRGGETKVEKNCAYDLVNNDIYQLCQRITHAVDSHKQMTELKELVERLATKVKQLETKVDDLQKHSGKSIEEKIEVCKDGNVKMGFFS